VRSRSESPLDIVAETGIPGRHDPGVFEGVALHQKKHRELQVGSPTDISIRSQAKPQRRGVSLSVGIERVEALPDPWRWLARNWFTLCRERASTIFTTHDPAS
jgi:hypothetical protein